MSSVAATMLWDAFGASVLESMVMASSVDSALSEAAPLTSVAPLDAAIGMATGPSWVVLGIPMTGLLSAVASSPELSEADLFVDSSQHFHTRAGGKL